MVEHWREIMHFHCQSTWIAGLRAQGYRESDRGYCERKRITRRDLIAATRRADRKDRTIEAGARPIGGIALDLARRAAKRRIDAGAPCRLRDRIIERALQPRGKPELDNPEQEYQQPHARERDLDCRTAADILDLGAERRPQQRGNVFHDAGPTLADADDRLRGEGHRAA